MTASRFFFFFFKVQPCAEKQNHSGLLLTHSLIILSRHIGSSGKKYLKRALKCTSKKHAVIHLGVSLLNNKPSIVFKANHSMYKGYFYLRKVGNLDSVERTECTAASLLPTKMSAC